MTIFTLIALAGLLCITIPLWIWLRVIERRDAEIIRYLTEDSRE